MPRTADLKTPAFCHHKASNQGYVKLNGKCVYLSVRSKNSAELFVPS